MRIHHLNCVSACPLGGFLMDGLTVDSLRGRLTSHCLLIETERAGLVLVDTGYGLRDVADPHGRLSEFFLALNKPELREEMTAHRQILGLGLDPQDVRHIVLSHLDFDHAGGLDDFPGATVHMMRKEERSAMARRTVIDKMRYRPQQWGSRERWRTYDPKAGEDWFGFACVRELPGVGPDVLLVPLVGHTLGHAGVAVRTATGWLFYAADAYFYHGEMDIEHPRCTPGLRAYQRFMDKDHAQRVGNQRALRQLKRSHGEQITIFCAHDVSELETLAHRPHRQPARKSPSTGAPQEALATPRSSLLNGW